MKYTVHEVPASCRLHEQRHALLACLLAYFLTRKILCNNNDRYTTTKTVLLVSGTGTYLIEQSRASTVEKGPIQGNQLRPVLPQKPFSPLTANTCDSSLDSELQELSNELSHVFAVKRESGFWVFGSCQTCCGFSVRLIRN